MKRQALMALSAIFLWAIAGAEVKIEATKTQRYAHACLDGDFNVVSRHREYPEAMIACVQADADFNTPEEAEHYLYTPPVLIEVTGVARAQTNYPADGDAGEDPPAPEGNDPPVWDSQPNPSCTEGVASSYDLAQHCTDPESGTLTFANETGCTLPTGVTIDDPNDELDCSASTTEGITSGCVFSCSDGETAVNSASFSIEIGAAATGVVHVVNGAGGDDFTTIGAAINQVACGETIQVKDGTYSEAIITNQNCAVGNEIVIEPFAGHDPVVTGTSSGYNIRCNHTGWDIGGDAYGSATMTFRGTNDGAEGHVADGTVNTNIDSNSDRCTYRGEIRQANNRWIEFQKGTSWTRVVDSKWQLNGTYNETNNPTPNGADGGNGFFSFPGGNRESDILIESTHIAEGGHAGTWFQDTDRLVIEDSFSTNNWSEYIYLTGDSKGNRSLSIKGADDLVIRDYVSFDTRLAADNTGNHGNRLQSEDVSVSQTFWLDHDGNGPCLAILNQRDGEFGFDDNYIDHFVMHDCDGGAFEIKDNGDVDQHQRGEVYIKNGIINNVGGTCFQVRQNSNAAVPAAYDTWQEWLFVDTLIIDQECTVVITDESGPDPSNCTLTDQTGSGNCITEHPANFQNIIVVEPNFVSTTIPTVGTPASVLSTAQANFAAQAAEALNAGTHLTLVDGVQSSDTTIEVDDAGWFRDDMGWSHRTGDQITLCGSTVTVTDYNLSTNVIEVNSAITCSDNAPIYRGSDSTPNIGAVVN